MTDILSVRPSQFLPGARFVIVGDAWPQSMGFDEYVKSLVGELGIQDRVIFTGFRKDALSITASLDMYVHSVRGLDALPRVILEAMASGVPVVAPTIGGIPEMVLDGETGILYPCGDVETASREVIRLLRDPGMADSMGKAAYMRAEECFSVKAHVDAVTGIYDELLSNRTVRDKQPSGA